MPDRPHVTRTRPIRLMLAGLFVVPLVSLLALWGFATGITLRNAITNRHFNDVVRTATKPFEALTNGLALERLQTFTWLSTARAGGTPPPLVAAARKNLDAAVAGFRAAVGPVSSGMAPQQAANLRGVAAQLGRLPGIRAAIDSGAMGAAAAFAAYSGLIDAQFATYSVTSQPDVTIYQQSLGAVDADRALEQLSREAALVGGVAAAHGRMSPAEHQLFASAVANQRLLTGDALALLNPQLRGPWARIYSSPTYHQFATLENHINARAASRAPIPRAMLQASQHDSGTLLAQMLAANAQDGAPLGAMANRSGNRLLLEAILAGGLGLVAVVGSVFLMVRFGRRITRELTGLHDSAQNMATERLPGVVERLRRGEDVDVDAESPAPASGKIAEIARVAEAFGSVQHTAVEAAVGQANLRKGVNQVFLNLSLRNQALLHRQLGMLDAMERATNEPEALADLFRLDHLTTRMRRHAEGLIILSGSVPGRGWRDPVPVVDVIRAAIAEVEDYVRVEVASETPERMVGNAVNDMIHLLAELIENATAFSPPNTRVEVRADGVGNGFVIEIEDRGLGLTAEEREAINRRLADPPEFDLANSDQLGLFVVGQLAARHGVKVSLRESPYGGTTAIVLLPHAIVVRPSEPGEAGALATDAGPADSAAGFTRRGLSPVAGLTGRHRLPPGLDAAGDPAQEPVSGPGPALASDSGPALGSDPGPAAVGWAAIPAAPARGPAREPDAPAPGGLDPDPVSAGTHLGLPRRVRQASLAPELRASQPARTAGSPAAPATDQETRSPEETRSMMSSLQTGWQRGRTDDLKPLPGDGPDDPWDTEIMPRDGEAP